jgi:hypothetical protein
VIDDGICRLQRLSRLLFAPVAELPRHEPAYRFRDDSLAETSKATPITVELLARRAPAPRTELERQIMIAQIGVDAWGGPGDFRGRRRLPRPARVIDAAGDWRPGPSSLDLSQVREAKNAL